MIDARVLVARARRIMTPEPPAPSSGLMTPMPPTSFTNVEDALVVRGDDRPRHVLREVSA